MLRFLLVGCERSGSTMFRLMLDHHPELSCMYESDFMVVPYERFRDQSVNALASEVQRDWHFRHSGLEYPHGAESYKEVIRDFFRQRMETTGTKRVGATVQHGFHHLPTLFPEARYVHLLRDGRPVAASMGNMGWVGNTYYGARAWQNKIGKVLALERRMHPRQWLLVRYENLLASPHEELERVCRFLGVSFHSAMLAFHEDTTYDLLDPSNAKRWKRHMSPREILEAEMAAGDMLDKLGYQRLFPVTSPSRVERAVLYIDHRIRRLRFSCRRYGVFLTFARKLSGVLGIRLAALDRRFAAIRDAHIK